MRTRIGWLGCLLAAALGTSATAYAQGPVENYEVASTLLPYPLGHPHYETGGFFFTAEFTMYRQDNPLREQVVATRGFVDTIGAITGIPGTFVGSGAVALDVNQVSGPLTYQPGITLGAGWRFENGVTVEVNWLHIADAKYSAAASLIPPNNNVGTLLQNTFLTSPVFTYPPEVIGPAVKLATPTNPPTLVPGSTPGIWNGSAVQQLNFIQRFDQGEVTARIPTYESDCWRSYGLVGARAVIMWERFKWRTVDYDITGLSFQGYNADYTNITSNRLYGPHAGWGNELYLGSTPFGAFSVSLDLDAALLMDIVKERAKYELEDRSISAQRAIRAYTIAPELSGQLGFWWYPIEAIQVHVGFDMMCFFNTIGSRQPIDFNYGSLSPEWNHIPTRFFDGFRAGIGFVF